MTLIFIRPITNLIHAVTHAWDHPEVHSIISRKFCHLPASEESTNMTRIIMRFRQGSQRCAIRAPHLSHEYKRHIDCLLSISPWESGGRKQRCIHAGAFGRVWSTDPWVRLFNTTNIIFTWVHNTRTHKNESDMLRILYFRQLNFQKAPTIKTRALNIQTW